MILIHGLPVQALGVSGGIGHVPPAGFSLPSGQIIFVTGHTPLAGIAEPSVQTGSGIVKTEVFIVTL